MKTIIKYSLSLFFIGFFNFSFSQEECTTEIPPEIAKEMFKKDMERKNYIAKSKRSIITLKLQPHIIRNSNGEGGLTLDELDEAMEDLNDHFRQVGIFFEMCDVNYIDEDRFYEGIEKSKDPDSDEYLMANSTKVDDAINVYYTPNSSSCGWASFPYYKEKYGKDWIGIRAESSCATNGSTLAHEMGHYFNLLHTHSSSNGKESVTRNLSDECYNCDTTGDLLCDTPADPELSSSKVSSSCVYEEDPIDFCGEPYKPDTRNIMAYTRKSCRAFFTPDQKNRLLVSLALDRGYLAIGCDTNQTCADIITVTENITSGYSDYKKAAHSLTASNTIEANGKAFYHAGETVLLASGFYADKDSDFWASIQECSSEVSARKKTTTSKEYLSVQKIPNHEVSIVSNKDAVQVAPNPNNGLFSVFFGQQIQNGIVQIYTNSGRLIFSDHINNQNHIKINIQNYNEGTYHIKVKANHETFFKKILLQKE